MSFMFSIYIYYIWGFPEIRVPPVIIHFYAIFLYKASNLGDPHLWNPPYSLIVDRVYRVPDISQKNTPIGIQELLAKGFPCKASLDEPSHC